MSLGLQLLRSMIDSGAQSAFTDIGRDMFTTDELPAFDTVATHLRQYGAAPSLGAVVQAGARLPEAPDSFAYYLDKVRERRVYGVFQERLPALTAMLTTRATADASRAVAQLARDVSAISNPRDEIVSADVVARHAMEAHARARFRSAEILGVPLGFGPLDRVTDGAQAGDLITFAARPGVGKTQTLIHAANTAWGAGRAIGFVTLEMTPAQVMRRLIGLRSGLNPEAIRGGRLGTHAEGVAHEVIEGFADLPPFHILGNAFRKSAMDIDRMLQAHPVDALYVDAAYLLQPDQRSRRDAARWESASIVFEELKALAFARGIPIIQTVQQNRTKKKGEDGDLSQLAGTDVIGQLSSAVVTIDKPDAAAFDNVEELRRYEVIKNREGPLVSFLTAYRFAPPDMRVLGTFASDGSLEPVVRLPSAEALEPEHEAA